MTTPLHHTPFNSLVPFILIFFLVTIMFVSTDLNLSCLRLSLLTIRADSLHFPFLLLIIPVTICPIHSFTLCDYCPIL